MAFYIYEELPSPNTIRLIRLAPGQPHQPIIGVLKTVELDKAPAYRAVSYAWEGSEKPKLLNTPQGSIPLTSSLHCAFTNLRSPKDEFYVWADAVCINQDNNKEKSYQVRLMGEIYTKAESVLVDLGENLPERDAIIKGIGLLHMLARIPLDLSLGARTNMIAIGDYETTGFRTRTTKHGKFLAR